MGYGSSNYGVNATGENCASLRGMLHYGACFIMGVCFTTRHASLRGMLHYGACFITGHASLLTPRSSNCSPIVFTTIKMSTQ